MRLGIAPLHGRPHHPQTQGKTERFNGTLNREVIAGESFADLGAVQRRFESFLEVYNRQRQHQAHRRCGACQPLPAKPARGFPERLAPDRHMGRGLTGAACEPGRLHQPRAAGGCLSASPSRGFR